MALIDSDAESLLEWGYYPAPISARSIIEQLEQETSVAISNWEVLPSEEPCMAVPGYGRVTISIPISATLFDQLMNGPTGYRAHYAKDVSEGERFNRTLIEMLSSLFIPNKERYGFSGHFFKRSLLGPHSKVWFSNEISDPSEEQKLMQLDEVLAVPRWVEHWKRCRKPRKGLLAPAGSLILLNGTFVNEAGAVYDQKPKRSEELFRSGWT